MSTNWALTGRMKIGAPGEELVGHLVLSVSAMVEYFSSSAQKWIPARVVSLDAASHTYALNCKRLVSPSSLRVRSSAAKSATSGAEADEPLLFHPLVDLAAEWLCQGSPAVRGTGLSRGPVRSSTR